MDKPLIDFKQFRCPVQGTPPQPIIDIMVRAAVSRGYYCGEEEAWEMYFAARLTERNRAPDRMARQQAMVGRA